MSQTAPESSRSRSTKKGKGLSIERVYTTPGTHPYDEVNWERRDVVQTNWRSGETIFEQRGVEFPDFWSVNASTIVTTKYFRGAVGSPEREQGLKQLLDRVVLTYTQAGRDNGYFATDEDAEVFEHELTWMLLHQVFSFNSPVWFNVGTTSPQQVSACQPYDALVSTPSGLVPIGELVEQNAVGAKVYDAHGLTIILAVKNNGVKDVLRIHTKAGYALDVTADHLVWKADDAGLLDGAFVEAGSLHAGDRLLTVDPDMGGRNTTTDAIVSVEQRGSMEVYDIQTESGEYLSGNIRVHNCFILAVDDSMDSILNWYREEGMIFKGGSGAGLNLSRIRSSKELLRSSGGTASGPVSFMRGADASAGTIKSGGATRRAAKMVVLDVDHPDIEEFVETKAREEDKIRVLRDAGYDMDLGGKDITSVQYQNANNSVRVNDLFMRSVEEGSSFDLLARMDGSVVESVDAKGLFGKIAQAAWECADPGIQYDDTINDWHTTPESGRINASNPCFTADTLVALADGTTASFAALTGHDVDVFAADAGGNTVVRRMRNIRLTRRDAELVKVVIDDGGEIRCTPDHPFMLRDGAYVEARDLAAGTSLARWDSSDRQLAGVNHQVVSVDPAGCADVYDGEVDELHNFAVVTSEGSGVFVHNCSEYMHLDNSSCNLASLNLLKFLQDDGSFDAKTFAKAVELVITAMDVSICFAEFPTEAIGDTTRKFRQLGIGYANLGALLMASGLAYDSDGGRALAGSITSLMTGTSYKRSAELAGVVGPYEGFAQNAEAHTRVMRKHAAANDAVRTIHTMDKDVHREATKAWEQVLAIGAKSGWRNAQASVIAPTGTISFMLDCDTTGLEPDFSLLKFKKLVGGGSMQIVNQTVPRALRKFGYAEETVEAIVEFIAEHGHVIDAPGLKREHYEVFDCAVGERSISPMGHVRMMAAMQPFVSGALSKTVNLPSSATVEEVADVYFQGWKLGLKALAIYRDNSKVGQPLSGDKDRKDGSADAPAPVIEYRPTRKRLPKSRPSITTSFSVGGAEGYMTAGSYPDDGLGEVFLKLGKQGSTLAGVMDAFSIAVSIGLQYGVPLETFVEKFTNLRFEPAGMTDDPDVRMAQSMMDYIFRRLALDYLPLETRSSMGIHTASERARQLETGSYTAPDEGESDDDFEALSQSAPKTVGKPHAPAAVADSGAGAATAKPAPVEVHSSTELMEALQGKASDAPMCFTCGTKMRPAGSCYVCEGCGSTSGCS